MSILLDIDASSRQSLDLPAEGLLGAARLAPLGPPPGFALRRSTWAAPKLSNPTFLMSGVRIETMARWKANRGSCTVERGLPAERLEPPTYGLQNRCTTTVLSRPGSRAAL